MYGLMINSLCKNTYYCHKKQNWSEKMFVFTPNSEKICVFIQKIINNQAQDRRMYRLFVNQGSG